MNLRWKSIPQIAYLLSTGAAIIILLSVFSDKESAAFVLSCCFAISAVLYWWTFHSRPQRSNVPESKATIGEIHDPESVPMALFAELNPDPILRIDRTGIVRLANPAAERILGTEGRRVVGASMDDLIPAFNGLDFGGIIDSEGSYLASVAIGSCFYQFTFRGLHNYQVAHAYGTDITERRDMERQLYKAMSAAQAAAKAKSEFLATMSHEIRTPMNEVMGMTELLMDSGLNEEQSEYAHTILSSAESLLAIINDILDFSKIESGKLELENIEFDLRGCIEEVAELFAPRIQGKGLEFPVYLEPDLPTKVIGDPVRFRQVVTNLVSNVIKFTDKGEIKITCSLVEIDRQFITLRVDVSDTGIGIPTDRQDLLFKSF